MIGLKDFLIQEEKKLLRTIGMQIKKVCLRADVKTSLTVFFLIPILIAFLISIKSGVIQTGNSVFSAMGYASVIIGLLKSLFLIGGIIALITTAIVSKEIDNGLDCTYFTKLKRQEYLFISKNITLICFITLIFLFMLISSTVGWFAFLRGTYYGNTVFLSNNKDEAILLGFSIISAYLEMITICELFCYISLRLKYSKAIVVNLVMLVGMKILSNIDVVQRWIPSFIGDATGLFKYSGKELIYKGIEDIIILVIYATVLGVIGLISYRKMDLLR